MSIFLLSNHVSAVWLDRFTKILVRLNFFFTRFSMDTSRDVPRVFALYIFDSVNEFLASIGLSLSQVSRDSKHIRGNSLVILNRFLHNDCLWETFLHSLMMNSISGSVENSFLLVTKLVLFGIKFPLIVTRFLLARSEIAVSISIHESNSWIIRET